MVKIAKYFLSFVLVFCNITVVLPRSAVAISSPVVISHILAGEDGAATSEAIALFNNSAQDVEVTGFCLKNKSNIKFACMTGGSGVHVFIKAHDYLTVSSTAYATKHGYQPDTIYTVTHQTSGSIVASGDTITLLDAANQDVDVVSWAGGLVTGATWIRKETSLGARILVDTGNLSDFVASTDPELAFPPNASYDVEPAVDVCPNLDNVQGEVLPGYRIEEGMCVLDLLPLRLTELLPNVGGADTGKEFIEIYNPTDRVADLELYRLRIETDSVKTHSFPADGSVNPGEYAIFYDVQMKFTLPNTTSKVSLVGKDNTPVSTADPYTQPADDEAWALIDGRWQYTNQPTPGAPNSLSIEDEEGISATSPTPCPEGKYRNPLTGRCRNIESDASVLATCEPDQYRNPETGRCRKLATPSASAPCKENQYRSEETNRCRNIVAASAALASCKEGQERNPETNRCRNVVSSMPAAGFAVEPIKQGAEAFIGWWSLGIVGTAALGYGVWEWRHEILVYIRKIGTAIKIK